jgi:serine/threonine protein kinase/Tol biopolymer transport system component
MGENPKSFEPAPPPRPSTPAPLIGSTVAHYRILERLGSGGMGVVYKGWDLRLERYAAVKFLSPQRSGSDDFKRRFTREARTASRLEHPNICTVFETDETEDGRLFIAMAFCAGESLKRKIERGPLPLPRALAIGAQVAAGLAAAHEKGVVHRDVKPGNIMVAGDDQVKIVDFGIARLTDETRLTRTGDVMGTTAYLAPEQFLSAETDQRADLWSLGVVLYEMVAARLPWNTGDERELVDAIVKRAPRSLSAQRPGIPQALERVVARALAKRPAERYQRAEELRADLLAVAELVAEPDGDGPYGQTVVEAPLPPSRERPQGSVGLDKGRADRPQGSVGLDKGRADRPQGSRLPPSPPPAEAAGAAPATAKAPATAVETGTGSLTPAIDSAATPERRPGGGMIGRIIGHYRIVGPLGGGGMGVVYKAQDLSLERIVALKFLPPELTRDPDAKTRFLQEARAASALDHPNICTIHEVGETDEGQLYLAMACYDGETLKQRLQRGRLPIDEALDTAQQAARGLVKAHRHGIVHRDIKPANLMITTDEIVKILDFGIAKLVGAAGLTRAGSSLGTPGYMSPEQARGEEVDPRTDVWSLGAVLYEMVTGRRPFRGEHEQTVLYSLFNDEPEPVQQLRPDAPPELARIIGRMLAKDPEQRYPTAAAAFADLRALYGPVTGTGSLTSTSSLTGTTWVPVLGLPARPRWRRLGAATLATAAVVAACLAAWLMLRAGGQGASASSLEAQYVRLTDLEGRETFPALSPDGNQFVYVKSLGGRSHIYWQRVGGGNPLDLSKDSPSDDTQPAYSPDGNLIAFRSERDGGGIFLMGSTGESARRLTELGYNPTWSPDGAEIAFASADGSDPRSRSGGSEIWRVSVGTGQKRLVSAVDGVQPNWSPGGSRIAYWGREPGGEARRTIWTIAAAGGKATAVTNDDHLNWDPVWSPDGKYLYFASNRSGPTNFWRVAIDEGSGKVQGDPEPLTIPAQWSAFLSFSRDGREFAYATNDGKSNLERVDFDPTTGRASGNAVAVTAGSRAVDTFAASPDSKWIAFATAAPQENLFVVHPDGTGSRQLTNDGFKNRVPRWSPDGSFIAFYSNRGGAFQAWTIRPDGSDLKLLSTTNQLYNPVLSPDGKSLACNVGNHNDLCLIDLLRPLAERRPIPLPHRDHSFYPFSWSLDGSRLVGLSDEPGIFVYSFPRHGYERLSTDAALYPVWLHDGRTVLYLGDGKVQLLDTVTRRSREVLAAPANSTFTAAAVGLDDRILYTLRSIQEGDIWLGRFK